MHTPQTLAEVAVYFPEELDEALAALADESRRGQLLAGGTDLMVQWEAGVRPLPAQVISIKHLSELCGIADKGAVLHIGAAVTHRQLRESGLVRQYLPSLAAAAATVGGYQIQAMGTIGGSLANASPAGDLAPSLLVAEARIVVANQQRERSIPATTFWQGYRTVDCAPDELIVRVECPKLKPGYVEGWRKLGPRKAQAISKVMGSFRGAYDGAVIREFHVAIGSVAPTCIRLTELESWLVGQPLTAATFQEAERRARDTVQPIDDVRSTAAYRRWVTGRMIRGFLETWPR